MREINIGDRRIADNTPTYFMADIASNHDGDLSRAMDLIYLAAEAGAEAVKFQHFLADKIVSDRNFRVLGHLSHQAHWANSVYDTYKQYELNREWTEILAHCAKDAGVHFLSTPYDLEAVDHLDPFVPAYKIGSGDINWHELIQKVCKKGKPVILSTGATTGNEVYRALFHSLMDFHNKSLAVLQCNTNYTGECSNAGYMNLNVLKFFRESHLLHYAVTGLSDHSPGHTAVLGAIALGARIIEKHFTDDNDRSGPDHGFSMTPETWREMVDRSRELESMLGDGIKTVEQNERETVVIQRRCVVAARDLSVGTTVLRQDVDYLRPALPDAIKPDKMYLYLCKPLKNAKKKGEPLFSTDFEEG